MSYYYGATHHQPSGAPSHNSHNNHHGGRARRGPRLSSQNSHRQFRGVRSMRELSDPPVMNAYLKQFEACKGFELDDDMEFCPGLLTEDDVSKQPTMSRHIDSIDPVHWLTSTDEQIQSISSSSDRSSMSSGSPSSSPLQQQTQPTQQVSPPFSLAQTYQSPSYPSSQHQSQPQLKIHQPSAVRSHKAIPIVNPNTGIVASPPSSISPARMHQQTYGRRW
ncbi:MAG: hypothetical protein MMC23_001419 [Stictis urceolatum]|nr:hypothetical protein [Stictis urceolata]